MKYRITIQLIQEYEGEDLSDNTIIDNLQDMGGGEWSGELVNPTTKITIERIIEEQI
jgi:hypothetical protein